MKKNGKIYIIIFVLAAFIGGTCFLVWNSATRERQALTAIIEPMFNEISTSGWDVKLFQQYTSPALKTWFEQNGLDVIKSYSVLGKLIKFNGVVNVDADQHASSSTSVAQFEYGMVYIKLSMSKHDQQWLIDNIFIESAS